MCKYCTFDCTLHSVQYGGHNTISAFKTVAKVPQIYKISRCYHEGGVIENRNWYYVKNRQQSSLIIPFHIRDENY